MLSENKVVKKALEDIYYNDLCTVIEYQDVRNDETKITKKHEVTVLENLPCKISFEQSNINNLVQSDTVAKFKKTIKLFISTDINIKAGSKIEVTHNQNKTVYAMSGSPCVYPSHQEIMLELFERWA